jgi:hypothetical protein
MSDFANVSRLLEQHPEWISALGRCDSVAVHEFDGTDGEAAARIWAFAMSQPNPLVIDKVWFSFGGGSDDYFLLNTRQALGLAGQDVTYPTMTPARRTEDAVYLARQGWRYDGQSQFIDMSKPERVEEFKRREAFAAVIPPSWQGCDPVLYWYLVLDGTVNSQPPDFGTRPDTNAKNWYGFSFQQWLDNQYAQKGGQPAPWKKGGVPA